MMLDVNSILSHDQVFTERGDLTVALELGARIIVAGTGREYFPDDDWIEENISSACSGLQEMTMSA